MSFATRFLIIITVIIVVLDLAAFYAIQYVPADLTFPFFILLIIATVIPIAINIWHWAPKYKPK